MKKILVVQKRDEMKKICWREKYFHQHILLLDIYLAIQKNYYLVGPRVFYIQKFCQTKLFRCIHQKFILGVIFIKIRIIFLTQITFSAQ